MERRSEIVDGLETLREAILGYDAATDPKGKAWDTLRVELDRSVLGLIEKAGRMVMVEMVLVREGPNPHEQVIAGIDLALKGGDETAVQVVRVENNTLAVEPSYTVQSATWETFRRTVPASWNMSAAEVASTSDDLRFNEPNDEMAVVWGVTDRGRNFIAAKLRVRARIGKHYWVGLSFEEARRQGKAKSMNIVDLDFEVARTPRLVGEGPHEADPNACLLTPLNETASIWIQNLAADGVCVLHKGTPLGDVEARPKPAEKIACRKCRGLHVLDFDCSNSPGTGRGVRAG